ncbi:L,D-transpeptidase [Pseudalkalibacillus caeni]|uniref:L,D-transpeptidase n=1 Tax=Exobacillus caeni TaxID=2574798 RepID=A0A5R9F211_9BACL|nr:L,D-transpeptidase [Pseudalkalibacillus caeni]TLS36436.1 L,D-transpeptidase [Pseudalkalibacillus caeni]
MSILLISVSILSPIWPLGENPLPGDPFVIVNKDKKQMAFLSENEVKAVFPVAIGKERSLTPEGTFTITVKAANPYYRKKNIIGGSKENPLGTRWIGFDADGTDGRIYGLHGTNRPESIGKNITAGCVRLDNSNIETLFGQIPIGTKILILSSEKDFTTIGREAGALKKEG